MIPELRELKEKKLIGKRLRMALSDNRTFELWKSFMPRRKEIRNTITTTDLISMQVYEASHDFQNFNPHAVFDKWAAIEVSSFDSIPEGMEAFTLPAGLYAVFIHHGPPSAFEKTFRYIFSTWLPASGYLPDHRPHFELLGEKYKNEHPDSEEEVWIPVRKASMLP